MYESEQVSEKSILKGQNQMLIQSEIDKSMASMKTHPSLTETELKYALEPDIKVLRIREINLDDGITSSYMFVDRDDAIEHLFDLNLRKNIPMPICFNRYPYMVELTLASSSEMKESSDIITKMAEMVFDNWYSSENLNISEEK